MKRTRDRLLIHIATGVLLAVCLVFRDAEAIRASALFKTTTTSTTTTTTSTEVPATAEGGEEVVNSTDPELVDHTIIHNLTGIPQIDYVHDPNLPHELNGYNLSAYPFLGVVPPKELINFKCDEQLHDGFYANVELKCQVYHQCLDGFRYDFLCANYTAFDQKTFICHFVSEVDCKNSHKFWKKNDDLYWYNTTTTVAPVKLEPKVIAPYLTQSRNDDFFKGTVSNTPQVIRYVPIPVEDAPPPRRRRPISRRRRPQYDYYDDDEDDYYEDERRPYSEGRGGSRRRKRPRPSARRPAYDDDYEDDRYDRRPEGRTRQDDDDYEDRRGYDRPRKSGRRPSEDRDRPRKDDDDDDSRSSSFDRPRKSSRPSDDKRGSDSDRRPYDDDRKSNNRPRRPLRDDDRKDERPSRDDKVKGYGRDDVSLKEEKVSKNESTQSRNERPSKDNLRPNRSEDRPLRDDDRPSKNEGRLANNGAIPKEESRSYSGNSNKQQTTDAPPLKPVGAAVFSKPRIPPKIARPVPKTEKEKYQYVPSTTAVPKQPADEEYYDDYELEDTKTTAASIKSSSFSQARPEQDRYKSPPQDRPKSNFDQDAPKRQLSGASGLFRPRRPEIKETKKPLPVQEDSYEDDEPLPKRPSVYQANRGRGENRFSSKRPPTKVEDEYYYDDEEPKTKVVDVKQEKVTHKEVDKTTTTTIASVKVTKPELKDYDSFEDDIVEKVTVPTTTQRLPFLSRNRPTETTTTSTSTTTTTEPAVEEKLSVTVKPLVRVVKRPFLPSRGGSPYLPRGLQPLGGKNFNKTSTTSTTTSTSTTTENVVIPDYSYDTDYDVKDDKSTASDTKKFEDTYSKEDKPLNTETVAQNVKDISVKESDGSAFGDNNNYYGPSQISYKERKNFNNNERSVSQNVKQKDYQINSSPRPYENQQDIKGPIIPNTRYQKENLQQIKPIEKLFKPSPQISDPYKPTNRPYSEKKIPENISIKQNLADSIENDYDVTINEALSPTLPNLAPIRNFPSPFSIPADRDYTFARFRNNYNQPDNIPQYSNFQTNLQNTPLNARGKFNSQRFIGTNQDSISSASDSVGYVQGITVRTPQSFYIQQPRYSASFSQADETNAGLRPPSHVSYRHVNLADYL